MLILSNFISYEKKANLLQSDVAALLGKSLLTYTKYEQGKTKIPKKDLEILSKEYQCEADRFLHTRTEGVDTWCAI